MDLAYQIPRRALVWVLLAVCMVIIPQALRMPLWITGIAAFCIAWRVLIHSGRLSYPGRWQRVGVVLITLLVSVTQLRSIGVGLDSAAALLTLGFVFKLTEMRNKRDIYVMICLCFVMSMVAFLYSQGLLITLYMGLTLLVIIAAMIELNRSSLDEDNSSSLPLALKISLQALPLAVLLFLLFPRIAPLWAVPYQSSGGSTGVSDEMSPGDLAQLGRSSELAFRVQFEGAAPPLHEDLYWRGLVLENFDGFTWRRGRGGSSYAQAANLNDFRWNWEERVEIDADSALNYNVIMEPTEQPWIFGLHLAEPQSRNLYQSRNFELFNNSLINKRLSYDLRSYTGNQTDLILLDSARRRATRLPDSGNARSIELARELRASVADDLSYVYRVLAYFQQNPFYYVLDPPLLGEQRVDDFLFNTRTGFCEHYASSFTFLMRAAGIPARVVAGYQGAEYNPYEDYMMVYQYNAHAWTEVWLEGRGWVRFDPTAAVSPERVQLGVEAALRDDPAFLEQSLFASRLGGIGLLNTLRLRLDALEYEWNRRVVNYDTELQFELFGGLLGEVEQRDLLLLMLILAAAVVAVVSVLVLRGDSPAPRDPVKRLYLSLGMELQKSGLGRQRGEGPLDYRDRVSARRPDLAELMTAITELYLELTYREAPDREGSRKQQMRSLRRLIAELRNRRTRLRPV